MTDRHPTHLASMTNRVRAPKQSTHRIQLLKKEKVGRLKWKARHVGDVHGASQSPRIASSNNNTLQSDKITVNKAARSLHGVTESASSEPVKGMETFFLWFFRALYRGLEIGQLRPPRRLFQDYVRSIENHETLYFSAL
jgi:glycerol-3-phosphate O-acyltransferase